MELGAISERAFEEQERKSVEELRMLDLLNSHRGREVSMLSKRTFNRRTQSCDYNLLQRPSPIDIEMVEEFAFEEPEANNNIRDLRIKIVRAAASMENSHDSSDDE